MSGTQMQPRPVATATTRAARSQAQAAARSEATSRTGQSEPPDRPPVDFTTVIADLRDLLALQNAWDGVLARLPNGVSQLQILTISGEQPWEPQGDLTDVRVGVVRHPQGIAETVAAVIAEQARGLVVNRTIIEPGYWLTPAGAPNTAAVNTPTWQICWNDERTQALRTFPRPWLTSSLAGASRAATWSEPVRVLLVDTGDERSHEQEAFVLSGTMGAPESPIDWHGHGTALAEVVRLRAPNAMVTSARVFEAGETYSASAALYNGLVAATSAAGEAHVVCVAQRAVVTGDVARFAETIGYILTKAASQGGGSRMPVIVCASGNSSDGPYMSLPATTRGVLVARAIAWDGNDAGYNCAAPPGVDVVTIDAYGGLADDLIGELTAADGRRIRMFGSSYAAALAAGALADG
jgi:hypothetical protein